MATELELSGYGDAAWDLSPAQLRARIEKLARMREAQDLRRFDATAMTQSTDEERVREWISARIGVIGAEA
jgi:hypothetical protein